MQRGHGELGQRSGLGGLPTPLVMLCAGGMPRIMLLLLEPQKWKLGCPLAPNVHVMQLVLVSYS